MWPSKTGGHLHRSSYHAGWQRLGKGPSHDCVTIAEVKDTRFVALRDYFDLMVGLKQLGLMPDT